MVGYTLIGSIPRILGATHLVTVKSEEHSYNYICKLVVAGWSQPFHYVPLFLKIALRCSGERCQPAATQLFKLMASLSVGLESS